MKPVVFAALGALAAGLAATPALAANDGAASNAATSDTATGPSAVTVTASRSGDALSLDTLGTSLTLLDAAALDLRQTRIVSDVLRDVPSLAVSRTGAVGGLTEVRIRGAEANQTLVMVDGIKVSDPYDGEFDFGTLIADDSARIEVLRGQQSSLYGSDAIGGVIHYITLTGAEAPGVRLRAEGGSMGTFSTSARVGGVAGALDYALSASYYHTAGYPTAVGGTRAVGSDSLGLSAKLIWAPAANLKITGVGRYSSTAADQNDTDQAYGSPTYGLTVDSPGVRYVNRAAYGLLRAELSLLDGKLTNAAQLQLADTTRDGYDVADPYAPIAGQPVSLQYGDHGRRWRASYDSAYRFDTGALHHRLTAALDWEREGERTTASPYGAYLGWVTTTNVGLVAEYELTGERFGLGGSLRRDLNSRFADDTTFRAQASYRLGRATRLHAAGGSGVKAPTFSQLYGYYDGRYIGDASLRPETSIGWEAGIGQSLAGGVLVLDATWFDNRLRDQIITTYDANLVAHPMNIAGATRQQGIELTAALKLARGWRLDATYSWLDAPQSEAVTYTGGATGTFTGQAVRRPSHLASANLSWQPAGRPFTATATVRYTGPQYDLFFADYPPQLVRLHGVALVNLAASWRLRPHVELFGRVENLGGATYQEIYSFAAQGRAGYGGLRVQF